MILLIIADFLWSLAALWVDIPKLATIPGWAWIFAMICPIYPFLLAFVWLRILQKKPVNSYLLAFAAIPSAIFGLLAIAFYPSVMIYHGFNWQDFGQIFWVLFYSIQGWYLIFRYKFLSSAALLAAAYLVIKFALDFKYKTFGYLGVEDLPYWVFRFLSITALSMSVVLGIIMAYLKPKDPSESEGS